MENDCYVPKHEHNPQFGIGYQQEMLTVPKDAVYAAIDALQLAVGYMPQIKTDVPEWQKLLEIHVAKMQCSLEQLKRLR